MRLSADGHLYTCLVSEVGHDLKTPLRDGESASGLRERIASIWGARTDRYSEERLALAGVDAGAVPARRVEMFRIGG